MKKLVVAVLCCVSTLALAAPTEGRYLVTVKRKSQDVYLDKKSSTVILTRYCYEYAFSDEAVLIWNGKYGDSKIVFEGGEVCDVKEVL